jgi:hypothetical protein
MGDTVTKAILIRDVSEPSLRVMKSHAALRGLSLQAWCYEVLMARLQQEVQGPLEGLTTAL